MAPGPEIRSSSTKNVLHLYITVCLPTSFKAANKKDRSVGGNVSHSTAQVGQNSSLLVLENTLWCVVIYKKVKCSRYGPGCGPEGG